MYRAEPDYDEYLHQLEDEYYREQDELLGTDIDEMSEIEYLSLRVVEVVNYEPPPRITYRESDPF